MFGDEKSGRIFVHLLDGNIMELSIDNKKLNTLKQFDVGCPWIAFRF